MSLTSSEKKRSARFKQTTTSEKPMNKQKLIEIIAEENEITKDMAGRALNTAIRAIMESVKEGEPVVLVGFGTFRQIKRKGRMVRNPQNGQQIQLEERKVPKFVPGTLFKQLVDEE